MRRSILSFCRIGSSTCSRICIRDSSIVCSMDCCRDCKMTYPVNNSPRRSLISLTFAANSKHLWWENCLSNKFKCLIKKCGQLDCHKQFSSLCSRPMNRSLSFSWVHWDGSGCASHSYNNTVFRWYEFKGPRLRCFLRAFRIRKTCFRQELFS